MVEDMISYSKADSDVVAERCAVVFGVAGDLGLSATEPEQRRRKPTSNISPCVKAVVSCAHDPSLERDRGLCLPVQRPGCHLPLHAVLQQHPLVVGAM